METRPPPLGVWIMLMVLMMMLVIIIKTITFLTIYHVPGTVLNTSRELTLLTPTNPWEAGTAPTL